MSGRARREQHKAELKGLILEAARDLFAQEGYERVSMRRLAQRVECAPGTLYLYFRDKDELLRAVVEESFGELLHTLQAIPGGGDALEGLKAKMRAYIEFGLRHPDHYRCAFVLPAARRTGEKPHAAFDELRAAVRACARRDAPDDQAVELASQVVWSALHGLTSLLIARPQFPWVEREELIEELIETATTAVMRVRA
ncbi:MAG TPA: TetR/AcrR family transcriptional regulator [Longimicrobiales bacterium]|nr:TetR/AcrR family transcriptional regulator [Longimicrobiales bacterium]